MILFSDIMLPSMVSSMGLLLASTQTVQGWWWWGGADEEVKVMNVLDQNFLHIKKHLHLVNIICYFWTEAGGVERDDYYSDEYPGEEYWDGGVARIGQAGDYYYYYEDEYYIDRQSGRL